ncbi:hypothetical protein [Bacillus tequilensis]|nr:hypothetical protein [Bacillus tequilensis]
MITQLVGTNGGLSSYGSKGTDGWRILRHWKKKSRDGRGRSDA